VGEAVRVLKQRNVTNVDRFAMERIFKQIVNIRKNTPTYQQAVDKWQSNVFKVALGYLY